VGEIDLSLTLDILVASVFTQTDSSTVEDLENQAKNGERSTGKHSDNEGRERRKFRVRFRQTSQAGR
jgi:hypothetical protein